MRYSVIVPVYNVAEYLSDLMDSMLPQLPKSSQIILVDDGSTDGSGTICDMYASDCNQVEVIHQNNGGVATARNAGLQVARGDYILWADPDDWVFPNWFSVIDRIIDHIQPDILHFDYTESQNGKQKPKCYGRKEGFINKDTYLRDAVRDIRVNNALWCRAFRRSLFAGYHFDESLRCLEDYALLHKLILRANTIYYIPEKLYCYRLRETGLVRTINLDIAYQSYRVSRQREQELRNLNNFDTMGVISQARGFCRNYYMAGKPEKYEQQFQECRLVLLSNRRKYLRDSEWPIKVKLKTLLMTNRMVGTIFAAVKKQF